MESFDELLAHLVVAATKLTINSVTISPRRCPSIGPDPQFGCISISTHTDSDVERIHAAFRRCGAAELDAPHVAHSEEREWLSTTLHLDAEKLFVWITGPMRARAEAA